MQCVLCLNFVRFLEELIKKVNFDLTRITSILVLATDDGALSLKEFQDFFSDGIMTSDELEELFHTIDTSKSK